MDFVFFPDFDTTADEVSSRNLSPDPDIMSADGSSPKLGSGGDRIVVARKIDFDDGSDDRISDEDKVCGVEGLRPLPESPEKLKENVLPPLLTRDACLLWDILE